MSERTQCMPSTHVYDEFHAIEIQVPSDGDGEYRIIDGHLRLIAALEMGMEVPIRWVDVDGNELPTPTLPDGTHLTAAKILLY